jgi:GT2 family glycosyltransferase
LTGATCLLEPAAVVRHVGSASSGKINGFAEYYGFRNRIWSFMRNMPAALLPISLPAHIIVTTYILIRSPELLKVRLTALVDAWRGRRPFINDRRRGLGASPKLLRALVWSPVSLSRRRPKTWNVAPPSIDSSEPFVGS